jgi:hypothetical protein
MQWKYGSTYVQEDAFGIYSLLTQLKTITLHRGFKTWVDLKP